MSLNTSINAINLSVYMVQHLLNQSNECLSVCLSICLCIRLLMTYTCLSTWSSVSLTILTNVYRRLYMSAKTSINDINMSIYMSIRLCAGAILCSINALIFYERTTFADFVPALKVEIN